MFTSNRLKTILSNPLLVLVLSCLLVLGESHFISWLIRQGFLSTENIWHLPILALIQFTIMFVIPAITIKLIFKKTLSDFGLSAPVNYKQYISPVCIILGIFLSFIYFLSRQSDFQNLYFVKHGIVFFLVQTIFGAFYYFGEEFIFRGLMHFSLWNRFKFHSLWIINIIFLIFHMGKPMIELYFAFFLGVALNYLSYKTKSFIPAFIIHWILALVLNILVTFVFFHTI